MYFYFPFFIPSLPLSFLFFSFYNPTNDQFNLPLYVPSWFAFYKETLTCKYNYRPGTLLSCVSCHKRLGRKRTHSVKYLFDQVRSKEYYTDVFGSRSFRLLYGFLLVDTPRPGFDLRQRTKGQFSTKVKGWYGLLIVTSTEERVLSHYSYLVLQPTSDQQPYSLDLPVLTTLSSLGSIIKTSSFSTTV